MMLSPRIKSADIQPFLLELLQKIMTVATRESASEKIAENEYIMRGFSAY